ncbi:hypothetical protein ACEPAI_3996 [Sanghuangporus weigelae]
MDHGVVGSAGKENVHPNSFPLQNPYPTPREPITPNFTSRMHEFGFPGHLLNMEPPALPSPSFNDKPAYQASIFDGLSSSQSHSHSYSPAWHGPASESYPGPLPAASPAPLAQACSTYRDSHIVPSKDNALQKRTESDIEEVAPPKAKEPVTKRQKKNPEKTVKGGRPNGSRNFSEKECERLVDIWHSHLPAGQNEVSDCAEMYNVWAQENGYVMRSAKAIKKKFQDIARTTKPTGDPHMPKYVRKAKEVESEIRKRTKTSSVSDSDYVGEETALSNDEDDEDDEKPVPRKVEWTRKPRTRTSQAQGLKDALVESFSPAARAVRDANKVEQQATAALFMSQINDLRQTIHSKDERIRELKKELSNAKDIIHHTERLLDKSKSEHNLTKLRLEFISGHIHPRHRDTRGGSTVLSRVAHSPHHSDYGDVDPSPSHHIHTQRSSSPDDLYK